MLQNEGVTNYITKSDLDVRNMIKRRVPRRHKQCTLSSVLCMRVLWQN